MSDSIWYFIALCYTMKNEPYLEILKSQNFDVDYDNFVNEIAHVDSNVLKAKIIDIIKQTKSVAKDINIMYMNGGEE